jgi:hypothetical protein
MKECFPQKFYLSQFTMELSVELIGIAFGLESMLWLQTLREIWSVLGGLFG